MDCPGLTEYTIEIETRPMVSLDPEDLDRLQEVADPEMGDPVFALDESKGSILAVFQVWAATAALAVALGCWFFTTTLVRSGAVRSTELIESIVANKANEDKDGKAKIQPPSLEETHT